MPSKFERLEKELAALVFQGGLLYYAMAHSVGKLPEKFSKELEKKKINLPNVNSDYETWYSEALRLTLRFPISTRHSRKTK